nr:unnamed protein product [Spirometra erinaceieuropaei]
MGSPLSGFIAEAILRKLETLVFATHRPIFRARAQSPVCEGAHFRLLHVELLHKSIRDYRGQREHGCLCEVPTELQRASKEASTVTAFILEEEEEEEEEDEEEEEKE